MQFSLRLLLEVTIVCAALLATVFVWGAGGFVVVSLLVALIAVCRRKWTASALIVITSLTIITPVLIAIMTPIQHARSGRSINCASNMHQITIALLVYAQYHGHFPPAYTVDEYGNRLHSWRSLILPELEAGNIYRNIRFDEPWDSPYNSQFHSINLRIFNCPNRAGKRPCTHYVAVVGDETAWPGSASRELVEIENSGETILLVEVEQSDIHWMEPRDLEFAEMQMQVNPATGSGISGQHLRTEQRGLVSFQNWSPGANVAFADCSTKFLRIDTPPAEIREMLKVEKTD